MYKILEQCIGELRVNHTDRDITEMVHGLFQIAKDAAGEYADDVTVSQLRADRPELGFMDDDEIEEILEQAKTMRHKRETYKRSDYREFMERCVKAHMEAFEDWPYGAVERFFEDEDGNFCIRYQGGMYWHYRETGKGDIEWW